MKIFQYVLKVYKETIPNIQIVLTKHYQIFNKPTLFLVILFFIALFPLFSANVNYLDDSARALGGGRGWLYLHSRWISEYLSILLHADLTLRDISPFTQLIAIFLISLGSVFLCWIVFNKKITKTGVLVSALLGLTPFFLDCFSFKFDSPYMALSVIASVFPFLFAFKNQKLFFTASFLSLLVMLTTYQFSSGIYIMIAIFLLFQAWNDKTESYRDMWKFLLVTIGSYVSALIFFKVFLFQTRILGYNNIFQINELLSGILDNFKDNYIEIIENLNTFWIFILAIIIIAFLIKSVIISKHNKILAFLVSSTVLFLLFFFFQGFFIFIENIGSAPRYLIGFNVFITLLALFLARPPYGFFSIPAIILTYCFFVFALSFGNALDDQKNFKNFFATMLIDDLSKIVTDKNDMTSYIINSSQLESVLH